MVTECKTTQPWVRQSLFDGVARLDGLGKHLHHAVLQTDRAAFGIQHLPDLFVVIDSLP